MSEIDLNLMPWIVAYENGDLEEEHVVELFQHLVDTGLAWTLQGSYGRTACDMIQAGLIQPANREDTMNEDRGEFYSHPDPTGDNALDSVEVTIPTEDSEPQVEADPRDEPVVLTRGQLEDKEEALCASTKRQTELVKVDTVTESLVETINAERESVSLEPFICITSAEDLPEDVIEEIREGIIDDLADDEYQIKEWAREYLRYTSDRYELEDWGVDVDAFEEELKENLCADLANEIRQGITADLDFNTTLEEYVEEIANMIENGDFI